MKFIKALGKLLVVLLIVAAVGMLAIFLGQNVLKYPARGLAGTPTDWHSRLAAVQNRGYAAMTIPGATPDVKARALWSQSRDGTVPALLWLHGRSEDITDTLSILGPMAERRLHVLSVEYPGYGDAEGDTTEANILAHAEAAFDFLAARDDVAPRRISVGGNGLGAAVALRLACRKDAAGVVAMATLPDQGTAVSARLGGIPVGFLLKDRFQVEPILANVPSPVLFVHGTADALVPLPVIEGYAGRVGKSSVLSIAGAGRDDIVGKLSKEDWDDIARFVFEGLR